MKHRGRHSSPPTVRDRRGIPIVQPSPSRSNVKLVDSSMEEDQDEIQLCKVPVKQNTPIATTYHQQQQQRSQFEQFNHTHQSPSVASSPRLDSWQDASTEPITPYKGDAPVNPMVYSPPHQKQLKKHLFAEPHSPNPIEAPPSRIFVPAILKRKAEDTESPTLPIKKLSRLSAQQKQKFDTEITNQVPPPITTVNVSKPNTEVNTFLTKGPITPIPEPKIHVLRDEEPVVKDDTTKTGDTEVKPEEENRKLTKEEEAARVAEEINYLMKNVKNLANYYKLVDKIGEGNELTVNENTFN